MTVETREYAEFGDLRSAAINYAQQASGQIWTDFNLHDPGVTLLEQSCFALTELAYRTAHPDRDLLTDARGQFSFQDMALFTPRKVLATDPVTTADLESWLSECALAARVNVTPSDAGPGLYDLVVVPVTEDIPHPQLQSDIVAAFDAVRPLCCDRHAIRIAQCRPVRLVGQVEMMPDILPESVAAAIYHAVSIILRGAPPDHVLPGATRKDAYAAPETLLHAPGVPRDRSLNLDDHLGELRALPAVRDIGPLRVEPLGHAPTDDWPAYLALRIPRQAEEIGLVLTQNGVALPLDPTRLRDEYQRIAAERISLLHHHLDAADWRVMRPGRPRDFSHRPVDSLLPMIYRAALESRAPGATGLAVYRRAIDGHLASMAQDLADLPRFFAAADGLPAHDPQTRRHRLALLDYLIALQGEDMPATRHTGLHLYLGTRARHEFELEWRRRYLFALPRLNATRATAPGARGPGGFLGRLCLLADLTPITDAPPDDVLAAYGLRIRDSDGDPLTDLRLTDHPTLPADPLDMLGTGAGADAGPLHPDDLRQFFPMLGDRALSPHQFLRLVDGRKLFLAPSADGWQVLFDDNPGEPPLRLGAFADHAGARDALARLRATWRHLHRSADTAALVEDIRLRGSGDYQPHRGWLVLAGWTGRGALPAFRNYVTQLVEQHAPAHLLIQPVWLTPGQSARFAALHAEAQQGPALRDFLTGLGAAP